MADVRFLIIFGPSSLDPSALGFPPFEPTEPPEDAASVVVEQNGHSRVRLTGRRRPAITGAADTTGVVAGGWFAWRLMASNNRRLARGVSSFASRPRAVAAIAALRADLGILLPRVLTNPRNGGWGWRAECDGVSVAAGPHWYERERDCRGGFGRFVDAAARARVAEGGTILRDRNAPAPRTFTVAPNHSAVDRPAPRSAGLQHIEGPTR